MKYTDDPALRGKHLPWITRHKPQFEASDEILAACPPGRHKGHWGINMHGSLIGIYVGLEYNAKDIDSRVEFGH
jgi:hypothetical protein